MAMSSCLYDSDDTTEKGCLSVTVLQDGKLKIEVNSSKFCSAAGDSSKVIFGCSIVGVVEARKLANSILEWADHVDV